MVQAAVPRDGHLAENSVLPPAAAHVTVTPSGRVTAPPLGDLDATGKSQYELAIKVFGAPIGPRIPLLNSPEVASAWDGMGQALAMSKLPRQLREIAILTVARAWKSEFEWYIHAAQARRVGVDPRVIEAIRVGREPVFTAKDQKIVYRYASELINTHHVSDATYDAAWKLLGTRQLVDLTVLLGHYESVSMTLNAHEVPLPDGIAHAF